MVDCFQVIGGEDVDPELFFTALEERILASLGQESRTGILFESVQLLDSKLQKRHHLPNIVDVHLSDTDMDIISDGRQVFQVPYRHIRRYGSKTPLVCVEIGDTSPYAGTLTFVSKPGTLSSVTPVTPLTPLSSASRASTAPRGSSTQRQPLDELHAAMFARQRSSQLLAWEDDVESISTIETLWEPSTEIGKGGDGIGGEEADFEHRPTAITPDHIGDIDDDDSSDEHDFFDDDDNSNEAGLRLKDRLALRARRYKCNQAHGMHGINSDGAIVTQMDGAREYPSILKAKVVARRTQFERKQSEKDAEGNRTGSVDTNTTTSCSHNKRVSFEDEVSSTGGSRLGQKRVSFEDEDNLTRLHHF